MSRAFARASSQYLEIDQAVVSATPLTMACWAYSVDAGNRQFLMWIGDKDDAQRWYSISMDGNQAGDPVRLQRRNGSDVNVDSTSGYSTSTWHHVAGVFTADNDVAILLDGGSKGTDATSVAPNSWDRTSIARAGDSSPGAYLDGRVAEAAVWDAALTDAEVAILAKGISPLFVRPQSLAAYWPLIRDSDDDIVGGYSMTPQNTPTVTVHPITFYPAPRMAVTAPTAAAAAGQPMMLRGTTVPHIARQWHPRVS
jgi:hypothetical protein